MNGGIPIRIEVWSGAYESVKTIANYAIAYDNDANAADTAALGIGCFKIYGSEIFHIRCYFGVLLF
jgi:hypothetical protein